MRRLRPWLPVLALASAAAAAAAGRLACPPAPPPADAATLEPRVAPLGLVVVRTPSPRVCFVCDGPRNYEELDRLRRAESFRGEWQGVVYCGLAADGEGERAGPWLLFGDPELQKKVARALR